MNQLRDEVYNELVNHILPFWMKLKDTENGGLYGEVNVDLDVNPKADKGGIAMSRFLWTFSAAYRELKDPAYLEMANHIYEFIIQSLYDHEFDGIYWMVDYKGQPKNTTKHVYTQSFGVYALSEYYRASGKKEALEFAQKLFKTIEGKGFNAENQAYMEEFDREWHVLSNVKLSGNGLIADITMNTHIHVLEAYTTLYKAWPSEELRGRLEALVSTLYSKIYNQETHFLGVFFDKNWNSMIDMKSFGHDIEASWLIDETLKALSLEVPEYNQMVEDIAYNIAGYAMLPDGSLANEQENDRWDKTKIWWVQAEAMVGYLNAYKRTGDEKFLALVKTVWDYTKNHIIDPRPGGEWYWSIEADQSVTPQNIGDPWKTSYHNGRFCLEILKRVKNS